MKVSEVVHASTGQACKLLMAFDVRTNQSLRE